MPGRSGAVPVTCVGTTSEKRDGDERNDETERHGLLLGEREKSITSSNTGGARNCHLACRLCGFPACQRAARVVRQSRGYSSPHCGLAAALGAARDGALPAGGEAAAAGLRRAHAGAARSQRPAAHGRGAGDRRARRRARLTPPPRPIRFTFERPTSPGGCTAIRRSSSSSICWRPSSAATPPPIGYTATVFRSCLVPGQSYARLTPFGGEPPENNIAKAQKLPLATAAGLWRLAEETLAQLLVLQDGGPRARRRRAAQHHRLPRAAGADPDRLRSGGRGRTTLEPAAWETRCKLDLEPLLREAVYLQCALGRQPEPAGRAVVEPARRAVSIAGSISAGHRDAGRGLSRPR